MRKLGTLFLTLSALGLTLDAFAQSPTATLRNGQFTATISLPDAQKADYRGTRFDWSGLISSLKYKGHDYVTSWSQLNDPAVADYEFRDDQIVTGINSTIAGLPEEFLSMPARTTQGWEEAEVGETFIKIGVGVLRKPDDTRYDHYRLYEIVQGSEWSVNKGTTSVTFEQTVNDPGSGYGYIYIKKVALVPGKAELTIQHILRNTGSKPIRGMVFDHNFMRWDNEAPGPDYVIKFGFDVKPSEPLGDMPLSFNGRTVKFTRVLLGKESIGAFLAGFDNDPKDYSFRIENRKTGIGLHVTADKPLARATIWGIRSVFAVEPFISYDILPGSKFSWKYTYRAYALAGTHGYIQAR